MRHSLFFILFLLFFSFAFRFLYAGGILNEYGKFVITETGDDYAVTFVLNPASKKFENIKEVEMVDYADDGEGNVSVVLYRNGNKEVFFRGEDDYRRHVLKNTSSDVCEDWSPKIVYRDDRGAWVCSKMNYFVQIYMWWQIDRGLLEAKKGEWDVLAERILKNVEKIKK